MRGASETIAREPTSLRWSYEVCLDHEVRQFHVNQDGSRGQVVVVGRYNTKLNEAADADGSSFADEVDADSPATFSQIYDAGERCDVTGTPRVAKVFYRCGEAPHAGAEPFIASIQEGSTCDYAFTIALPAVCAVQKTRRDFEAPLVPIDCAPVEPAGEPSPPPLPGASAPGATATAAPAVLGK